MKNAHTDRPNINRFVGQSEQRKLRQGIRQFENSQKTDEYQAKTKDTVFQVFKDTKTNENNP